jgi:acyl-CoA synthetase (AMP-forming)/AMP-acid ligase II
MRQHRVRSLSNVFAGLGGPFDCRWSDARSSVGLCEFVSDCAARFHRSELSGRSVLLRTSTQIAAAAALFALDGLARRVILCTPDLSNEDIGHVIDVSGADTTVTDDDALLSNLKQELLPIRDEASATAEPWEGNKTLETEWILLTSGTTGLPKLVQHTLASLTGAIEVNLATCSRTVWATFYDIRRYGGLQILLRAILTGSSMVFSDARESITEFLARAGRAGVTHISGTPSHWRQALMSPLAKRISPAYVRLSGEAVDRAILSQLRSMYPQARIVHAFASTEAGIAFEVHDGESGFPTGVLDGTPGVDMEILEGTLRIRSNRTATIYLGKAPPRLRDDNGFVDTGDLVELRGDRYHFAGRRDHVISVGGLKVHPEEIEEVLNRHPGIQVSLVHAKKSSLTGSLVVADVVLRDAAALRSADLSAVREDIRVFCRGILSAHKTPAIINVVPSLPVAKSGKVMRQNA